MTSRNSAPTPPDPNLKPDYSERFHLAGYNRIQQQESLRLLQEVDLGGLPALPGDRDRARQSVLRRQLCGELGEPRALWRRDQQGADPLHREEIPRRSGRAGRASPMAARPAAGRRWRPRCSIPTCTTAPSSACPDPIDFHAYDDDQSLRRQERLCAAGRSCIGGAPGHAQLSGRSLRDPARHQLHGTRRRATTAVPAGSTTSGRRCSRPRARTAIPSRSSTR